MSRHRDRRIQALLERYGFAVTRDSGKHCVCRNRAGAQVVVAKTPSDHRVYHNIETLLRRVSRGVGGSVWHASLAR